MKKAIFLIALLGLVMTSSFAACKWAEAHAAEATVGLAPIWEPFGSEVYSVQRRQALARQSLERGQYDVSYKAKLSN